MRGKEERGKEEEEPEGEGKGVGENGQVQKGGVSICLTEVWVDYLYYRYVVGPGLEMEMHTGMELHCIAC